MVLKNTDFDLGLGFEKKLVFGLDYDTAFCNLISTKFIFFIMSIR